MKEPIVILGATSSIARAIAVEFAGEEHNLILAGRNREELSKTAADLRIRYGINVAVETFEAVDFSTHERFFANCLSAADGKILGVVLCQGFMADQTEAQSNFALTQRMIDVNFTSAVSILNHFADYFEANKRGFVCGVSSVAGDRGRQSNYLYGCTKAALNTFMEGLRNRLAKAGVPVLTVKPGFVDTRMTWGLPGLFLVAGPQRVGRDVCRAIRRNSNEIYTPWFWWGIMTIICNVPRFIFKKTKL